MRPFALSTATTCFTICAITGARSAQKTLLITQQRRRLIVGANVSRNVQFTTTARAAAESVSVMTPVGLAASDLVGYLFVYLFSYLISYLLTNLFVYFSYNMHSTITKRYRYFTSCLNTGWAKKRGHRLMTIILSNLNRFTKFFSLEDSLVNFQLNGY